MMNSTMVARQLNKSRTTIAVVGVVFILSIIFLTANGSESPSQQSPQLNDEDATTSATTTETTSEGSVNDDGSKTTTMETTSSMTDTTTAEDDNAPDADENREKDVNDLHGKNAASTNSAHLLRFCFTLSAVALFSLQFS
uniref:Uncharacterized protein n=1 Tax=Plectus sambesii TaxID=2011161 RepID=A0A914XKY7_9BILA